MNFQRAFKLWRKPTSVASSNSVEETTTVDAIAEPHGAHVADPLANVVQLPTGSPFDSPAGLCGQSTPPVSMPNQPRGLLEAPELQNFLADNHFGLGRHNGAQYKTQAALELGRQTLVAKFQNTIELLVAQRQAKVDALRNMALQTQGVCATVTSQLTLACQRLERDIETLHTQSELAAAGKGWVLRALNEYQIGFGKGLREAIDMELLT
jgi:hypothetical protein